jgi:hypothetical protein
MPIEHDTSSLRVRVPVRTGPYQYVRVDPDGVSSTIPVDAAAYASGAAEISVRPGERIVEIALSSTSDPDLDPPLGQLWPEEAAS